MPSCSAETHLFSSHPTIDASEASVSRAWGPCRPVSPKYSIKASHETRNRPWSAWAARWQVGREHCLTRNVIKRHDLTVFASHFRDRVHLPKKVPLGVRLISTRRRPPRVFYHTSARGPEIKSRDRGCSGARRCRRAPRPRPAAVLKTVRRG